nr:uncharacterized protein LOC111426790 [Onthophagus taurus]
MLKIIILSLILFKSAHSKCEKPKYLLDNEQECLEITTSVFERFSNSATGVFNMAKKKLGIDYEEEPLKCSYYLCVLHNLKMVTESGILNEELIKEWMEGHIPGDVQEEFTKYSMKCNEDATKLADVSNCQKATEFIKCLSQYEECKIFKFP